MKKRFIETTETLMSLDEVREILFAEQPKEIWCKEWSSKKPFIIVHGYFPDTDEIKYTCNPVGESKVIEVKDFYNTYRYCGLRQFEF